MSLLFNQKGSLGNVELHKGFLLVVYGFKVPHLISGSLETMSTFSSQIILIVTNGWRLLNSICQSNLFNSSNVIFVLLLYFFFYFLGLSLSSKSNQSFMFFRTWWINSLCLIKVFVQCSRFSPLTLFSGVYYLIICVQVFSKIWIIFRLVEVEGLWCSKLSSLLISLQLSREFFV